MSTHITFETRKGGPERYVADAAVHFDEGLLEGAKLVGFSLWRSAEGEVYVTFPSRSFGAGGERRFYDLLRAPENPEAIRRIKDAIVQAWHQRESDDITRAVAEHS